MAAKKPARGKASASMTGSEDVDAFLLKLKHPLKPELEAVRKIILGADPRIREGIKWNAPSFRFEEYFATAGLRPNANFVHVIFHKGAKVKDNSTVGMRISDPSGMLEWLAEERCAAKFHDLEDVRAKEPALRNIVKQWIRQM